MKRLITALLLIPTLALGDGITIEKPMIPLAPPSALAHAAFMTLTNAGDTPKVLIGASAERYMMAHIHKSEETDGVATMSSVDMIEIAPGQSVMFEHGGLHIMLMRPQNPMAEGDMVSLTLEFADGTQELVEAMVMPFQHGM